ncbi:MAG: hypothetical protein UV33_C0002G0007 [Candidatus Daviesbacteria bacterium GW2011_GWA1_42_6]|uniref:Glycosyltransferase RgtA/B/C/D-like domain-containing protein n=1 Tax=Candidatus Daviesbacteria bacterium GW2011_GWA1_42_6 TaxID=1618420 RepID=A0A0G1D3L6_9BACT|nr:MAG: hypothetical protein UV33_C0002G0007 [Candidatus Daviesbacteria bacterium GW2011_GWA1_42_6]
MNKIKSSLIPIILIILAVAVSYSNLTGSFFEQDEWHSFGYYTYLSSLDGLEFFQTILQNDPLAHFTPLSLFFKMEFYRLFGLNSSAYFFASITFHVLVSLTVYFLALQLTKKKLPAALGGLFFAVNSSHYQAVTWLGTFEGAELSTLFGALSLIGFLIFLDTKRKVLLNLSLLSILIALLFKETALTFLLLLATLIVFKETGKNKVYTLLKLGGILLFYILLRSSYLIFGSRGEVAINQEAGNTFLMTGYNVLSLPIKVFSQVLLPNELMVDITNKATTPFGLYQYFGKGPWILENALRYDFLMIPAGLIICLVLFLIGRRLSIKLPFYLGLLMIIFTLLPFLVLKKYLIYFDSRYLYTATVGFSLIISTIIAYLMNDQKFTQTWFLKLGASLAVLAIIFSMHLIALKDTIDTHVKLGSLRKQILSKLVYDNPKLPKNAVFYTESDSVYYGLPDQEKILPFQSGFGQTLLVYYQQNEQYSYKFYKDFFLWEISEQGYRETDGRGFGYYHNFDLLKKDLKQYNIPTDSIIAYSWNSKASTLINITDEVKARLDNEDN